MPRWDVRFDLAVDLADAELVRAVATADALAKVIRGVPISPFRLQRLHRLNILRAVRGTTGIEGSDLTEEEVGRVLDAPDSTHVLAKAREREEREVRNANTVFQFVAETLDSDPEHPIDQNLVREIHRRTTEGIQYENNAPGAYRAHNVTADTYSAPPAGDVQRLMDEFAEWIHTGVAARWPALVRAAAAHFYLISIHPFGDGNGRTARAVESFVLYQARLNACGFYSLANYYYRRRSEYIRMLDFVRFESSGDLTPFICFSARGFVEELETVRSEVFEEVTEIAFRDYARERLQSSNKLAGRGGDRMLAFLLHLTNEWVSLSDLRTGRHPLSFIYKGVSRQTLARDIEFLEQQGLIVRDGDRVRARREVMEQYKL